MSTRGYTAASSRSHELPEPIIHILRRAQATHGQEKTARVMGVTPGHLHRACCNLPVSYAHHEMFRDFALWWDSANARRA